MASFDLTATLGAAAPPAAFPPALQALWWEAHGDWGCAHALVQDGRTPQDCWVHAYLHRVEGDLSNAAYWYRRAGRPVATGPLERERAAIAAKLASAAGLT